MTQSDAPLAVVIMAAGEGTRMKSRTPKVLHQVAGRSLVGHAVHAARQLQAQHLVVMIGAGAGRVREHLESLPEPPQQSQILPVVQEPRNGTGHAVRVGLQALAEHLGAQAPLEGTVVVTSGDCPLVRPQTLAALVEVQQSQGAAAVVLTGVVDDPTGYGRVIRAQGSAAAPEPGQVQAVVEHKDATEAQRQIKEINTGFYAFDAAPLTQALAQLTTDNAQGEEYLVDVIALFANQGLPVVAMPVEDTAEALGVNDRAQLAQAAALLRDRIVLAHQRAGVTIVDPASTWIDADVSIEPDAVILPGCLLEGATDIAADAVVGPRCRLRDTTVGQAAIVADTTATLAVIGEQATVGPYTYLRPGTVLERGAKAGAYVEIKNSTVGEGSKVPHLSYVGDAQIGRESNIGAATIFVNYDGVNKHRTVVGDAVRIGSDTMLVAPVTIGDGAYTAAGSVVTEDVPAGALAVARARQHTSQGWVQRRRPGSASARAAERHAEAASDDAAS